MVNRCQQSLSASPDCRTHEGAEQVNRARTHRGQELRTGTADRKQTRSRQPANRETRQRRGSRGPDMTPELSLVRRDCYRHGGGVSYALFRKKQESRSLNASIVSAEKHIR